MAGETRNIEFKIQIPALVASHVERERLIEEYSGRKAVVFHAGAGFGKTMLMAAIAHRQGRRCAWYQLAASDNEPEQFLEILTAALGRALPEFDLTFRSDVPETWAEELAAALAREVVGPVLLVFDDFQEVVSPKIYELLASLMSLTPQRVQFFFATKGVFPPFLAAFLAREQAVLVGQEEMKFTLSEAEEFLEKITGNKPAPDLLEKVYAYAEGWPAGLRFAGMGLVRYKSGMDLPGMFRGSRIYDYIAYEVFRKLPFELQQFLMDTAMLEPLNPALCDYVTGRTNSRNNLDYLAQENLFVYRLEGEKVWYRYHSIFRDFLISSLSEERKTEILKKAAAYCMRRKDFEQGVRYAVLCQDYDTVKQGIERYGGQLIREGRRALLNQWLDVLKDSDYYRQLEPFLQTLSSARKEVRKQNLPRMDVHCMGGLKAWSEDGKAVAWRTKKTKELFACLFERQGKETDKERLTELLWPERDAQKSSSLFDTTASYLKKALAAVDCGHVLVVENKQFRLEMGAIRSDYQRFLELTKQLARGQFELMLPEGPKALADLYREGYLAGEDYPWALPERERLEQRYLDAMFLLTDHYMEQEEWRMAAETAAMALHTDPFSEELVGMLLDSLVKVGDVRGAKKQFERLNSLWVKELGQELYYDGFL